MKATIRRPRNIIRRRLRFDPENLHLLESVVVARLALGEIQRALPVAQKIVDNDLPSQAARMVLSAGFGGRRKI